VVNHSNIGQIASLPEAKLQSFVWNYQTGSVKSVRPFSGVIFVAELIKNILWEQLRVFDQLLCHVRDG